MPALTMRGRYLMREYWTDSDLFLRLSADEREVYIGLWMLADDAGWLPRDVQAIGAALAHYENLAPREKRVRDALEALRKLGKVASFRCCLHLPAVEKYPRAGRKSSEHLDAHRLHAQKNRHHSKSSNDIQRDLNASPVPSLPVPSLPVVAGAGARDGAPRRGGAMTKAAESAGGFVARIAAKGAA